MQQPQPKPPSKQLGSSPDFRIPPRYYAATRRGDAGRVGALSRGAAAREGYRLVRRLIRQAGVGVTESLNRAKLKLIGDRLAHAKPPAMHLPDLSAH